MIKEKKIDFEAQIQSLLAQKRNHEAVFMIAAKILKSEPTLVKTVDDIT